LSSSNIFDNLPALKPPEATVAALEDELAKYLSTPWDLNVKDGLRWWYDRKHLYPRLPSHRMAMDYLSIPGKFFFVFSIDCLLIHMISQPHQSMLNEFSVNGEEEELAKDWDSIF
jgi:hypothetical protein